MGPFLGTLWRTFSWRSTHNRRLPWSWMPAFCELPSAVQAMLEGLHCGRWRGSSLWREGALAPWGPVFKEVLLFQLCGPASGSCRPGGGRGADSLAVAVLGPLWGSTEACLGACHPRPLPDPPRPILGHFLFRLRWKMKAPGRSSPAGSPETLQGHPDARLTCSPPCPPCWTLLSAAQDPLAGGFPVTSQGLAVLQVPGP